jgi:hypothetical protein
MQLLIATTNPAKIDRYTRYFSEIDPNLAILTLLDLDEEIEEPAETGQNVLENSQIKAKYYLEMTSFNGLIFAEDTGMNLLNVAPEDNPGKDIKKPILKQYGNLDPQNMVNYYSELAKKYGGKIAQEWIYGFTLASNQLIQSSQTSSISYLVSEVKYPIQEGHPLGAICLIDESDSKYWNELSNDEKYEFFDKKCIELIKNLLTPFIK